MALKPIEPKAEAAREERDAYQRAQDHARAQPHLWANGPEHQMRVEAANPSRSESQKK
jgi:hypothetical protein